MYIMMLLLCSGAEQQNVLLTNSANPTGTGTTVQNLMQPIGTDYTNPNAIPLIGGAISLITNVWTYILPFIQMVFLWQPTLWTGSWILVYYVFCIPLSIGFIASIVFIFRGVHNG